MSNTPQPPADGWQPPQSPQEPPVYRPHEQPPTEEPPPWSPESQRMSPPSSQRMSPPGQQVPVEDIDGTVKYTGGPSSRPQAPFGPPPGVPVSPFDGPMQHPGAAAPAQGMPPVSAMPAQGMPPVSGMPASGMPVSPGQGQFGPQGGQLVPVSGAAGQQPWGGAQPGQIQRKKKGGGKAPLWILLAGVVVIAAALGVGGFILFNPMGGDGGDDTPSATIETPTDPEPMAVGDATAGLNFIVGDGAAWTENSDFPTAFTAATGVATEDGASAFVGTVDLETIGAEADAAIGDVGAAFDAAIAAHLEGEAAETETQTYWIDARPAQFRTFTVGDTTVFAAIIELEDGYAGFAGFADADDTEVVESLRDTLQFGEPAL